MPLYSYTAKTKEGRSVKQVQGADSKEQLVSQLRSQGLFIVSLKEMAKDKRSSSKTIRLVTFKSIGKRKKVTGEDLGSFARNLAITLASGMPLLRSLDLISEQTESATLGSILKDIAEKIKTGLSLHEAAAKHSKIFSPLWLGILEVGETAGNLPLVLERLADYLELREEYERKVKSAMVYPIMVTIAAAISIFIFFRVILPKFTEIFVQFDIELPALTQFLFNMSKFFNQYFIVILAGTIGLIVGFTYFKKTEAGKIFLDSAALTLPVIDALTLSSCLERFSSTMHILLESGVPIIYTIDVVSKIVGNSVLERNLLATKENVKKGATLSSELRRIGTFPPFVAEITRIGEETGNLGQMFEKISRHYQKQLSTRLERMVAMFEPLMISILGAVIGTIVIGLFLPIFKLVTLGG